MEQRGRAYEVQVNKGVVLWVYREGGLNEGLQEGLLRSLCWGQSTCDNYNMGCIVDYSKSLAQCKLCALCLVGINLPKKAASRKGGATKMEV